MSSDRIKPCSLHTGKPLVRLSSFTGCSYGLKDSQGAADNDTEVRVSLDPREPHAG
jgi:hypothetical protein